jgi:hypothetical protein
MKKFLYTHSGKGTVAVYLSVLLLIWPPALAWLVAAGCLVFAGQQFREAFRQVDKEIANRPDEGPFDASAIVTIAARGNSLVPATVIPERSAQPVTPAGQEPLPEWLRMPA